MWPLMCRQLLKEAATRTRSMTHQLRSDEAGFIISAELVDVCGKDDPSYGDAE